MVCARTFGDPILDIPMGSAGRGCGQAPRGNAPPPPPHPPVSLEQLLATWNDLMRLLMENETRHGADRQQPRHQDWDSSYSNFLATHPPIFAKAMDPARWSPSLGCCTIRSTKGLCTWPNNFEAQLEPGGPPTMLHYPLIIRFYGASTAPPSVVIISQRVFYVAS
jgi:hypothetical protein